jgi:hypothetical protein
MLRIGIRRADMVFVGSFEGRRDGSGILEFLDGRMLNWSINGLMHDEWWFTAQDGLPLVRYRPETFRGRTGQVEISPKAFELDELTPLIFLGWYIIYLITGEESGFYIPAERNRTWSFH